MPPTIDGLFSGLDTTSIINDLLSIEARPIVDLQKRAETTTEEKTALLELSGLALGLKTRASHLQKDTTFNKTDVSSSNSNAIYASGREVSTTGSFNFRSGELAKGSQYVSAGFADKDLSAVGAGTLTLGLGGELDLATELSLLRGGKGVAAGTIRITDRAGGVANVDIGTAATVGDVLDFINGATGVSVQAKTDGDRIILSDLTSGSGNLKVEDLGSTTASDLGIKSQVASSTLTGSDVSFISGTTSLQLLNDGNGMRAVSGNDLRISLRDGTNIDLNLTGKKTVDDVLSAINSHASATGKLTASVSGSGKGLTLTDTTGVVGSLTVSALNSSFAADDLGLLGSASGAGASVALTGSRAASGMETVLLKNLRGGQGINLGTISITDRSGANASVNLSGESTLQEVLDAINSAAGVSVQASVNSVGNGIQIEDTSGSTAGNLIVTDTSGTAAQQLDISTVPAGVAKNQVVGASLHRRFISDMTRLDMLNQGGGVFAGKFRVTNSSGQQATIDLSQKDDIYIEDVLQEISAGLASVTATINADGNGILLTDSAGGSGKLTVTELDGGTTAADLNILGTATTTTIDGAFEYDITISATDTLEDVQESIQALGLNVQATIIDSGAKINPYQMVVTGSRSGSRSHFMVDPGSSNFSFQATSRAEDSVLLFGSGVSPVRLLSAGTVFSDIVEGLTIDLKQANSGSVTVAISQDRESIADAVNSFVDKFNGVVQEVDTLTSYNPDTETRSILFGDTTANGIRSRLQSLLTQPADNSVGQFRLFSQLGVRLQNNGTISFNRSTFMSALEKDFKGVQGLLAHEDHGLGKRFEDALEFITDPVDGSITRAAETRDRLIDDINERIETLQDRIVSKREMLRRQFTSMEQAFFESQSIIQRLGSQLNILGGGSGD